MWKIVRNMRSKFTLPVLIFRKTFGLKSFFLISFFTFDFTRASGGTSHYNFVNFQRTEEWNVKDFNVCLYHKLKIVSTFKNILKDKLNFFWKRSASPLLTVVQEIKNIWGSYASISKILSEFSVFAWRSHMDPSQ